MSKNPLLLTRTPEAMLRITELENHSAAASPAFYRAGYPEDVKAQSLVKLLRRRWKLVAGSATACLLIAGLYNMKAKPIYRASATMLVDTQQARQDQNVPVLSDILGGGEDRSVRSQIVLLQKLLNNPVLLKKLSPEALEAYKKGAHVDVINEPETNIIEVQVLSDDRIAASQIANVICEEYIEQSRYRNRRRTREAINYVDGQVKQVRTRLDTARAAYADFKQSNGLADLSEEAKARVSSINEIQNDIRQTEAGLASARLAVARLQPQVQSMPKEEVLSTTTVPSPEQEQYRQQLVALEAKRAELRQEFTPMSPEVRAVVNQIEVLKARLATATRTEVSSQVKGVNSARDRAGDTLINLQSQLYQLTARREALRKSLVQSQEQLAVLPKKEYRLGQLTADMEVLQQTYSMLNEKLQDLRIQEQAQVSYAELAESADVPSSPVRPHKSLNFVLSAILGLMLGLMLAALLEKYDRKIHSIQDIEFTTQLPVLSVIPMIRESQKRSLIGGLEHVSPLLESYRMLRTNIMFSEVDEAIRTLMVTSCRPNEGKSTAALNLALAMALDNKKVLLIDCDLRRPTLHTSLNKSNTVGFTNVVTGKVGLEEAWQQIENVPNLMLLSSGPTPPNPPELLNTKAAHTVFKRAAELADVVIIDTPPGLAMADAPIVASNVDAVLIVSAANEVRHEEVYQLAHMMTNTSARVLGFVLNKVTDKDETSYYSYYNRYYSNYVPAGSHGAKEMLQGAV